MGKERKNYLNDEKNEISWERFQPEIANSYRRYNELVNSWSSNEAIQRYIHFDDDVADTMVSFLEIDKHNRENMFYAFDEGLLVGVVYITEPYKDNDETYIDYLIVNPDMKGRGIGTRMISSIKANPKFFSMRHRGVFTASVEHTNEPSKRMLIKNGFKMYKPVFSETLKRFGIANGEGLKSKFGRWYFDERGKDREL